jgi:GTP-binding protein EngB required for normal cell division
MSSGEYKSGANLNEHQARCLSVTCQYVDKIIGEMEHVLNAAASKAAFPKYIADLSSSQRRTIEDYFARIRAQLARVLDGQDIARPEPTIPASRAVSTGLLSIEIAVEELRPSMMRGYGELSPEVATELEGICGELRELVSRVSQYLLQDAGQDLPQRLARLEQTSAELGLLAKIERVVAERGLVEFRSTIAGITDRLEDRSLEIAVFGRVSSGKSSLLNAILGQDILPVGVTPITAVPARIHYHIVPSLAIWYADRLPETLGLTRLAEFASEQGNPRNQKRVTRMIVHIPSARLREGVTLVDTPGLGSLATTGAAETLAYLPNCDLGVVLIDAGSTITQADLETIQALHQAGIPVQVLLSKADLLSPQDQERMISYVKENIANEYRMELPVFPVSAIAGQREMLEQWFRAEILPMYERYRELKSVSIRRKVGALRDAVVAALTVQLRRSGRVTARETEQFREVEAKLRKMTGRISETRNRLERDIRGLEEASALLLERSAMCLAEKWASGESDDLVVFESIVSDVHVQSKAYRQEIEILAQEAHTELENAAKALGFADGPSREEFIAIIRGMPVFDFVEAKNAFGSGPSLMRMFGGAGLRTSARRLVRSRLNQSLTHELFIYSGVLREWATTVVKVIETRFVSCADAYRAQTERALKGARLGNSERDMLLKDVRELGGVALETGVSAGSMN